MAVQEFRIQDALQWTPTGMGQVNAPSRIEVGFVDLTGTAAALTAVPTLVVIKARTGETMPALTMVAVSGATGRYYTTAFLNDWEEGLYQFKASGTLAVGSTAVTVEGSFMLNAPSPEETLVHWVKSRLKDIEPRLYKLDLPVPKWNPEEITRDLYSALQSINYSGPMETDFTLSDCPRTDLLIDYAFAKSLTSAAVLENWNSFTMSDGSTNLTINRTQAMVQLADGVLNRFRTDLKDWKMSLRPRLLGQGTGLFPFSIRRAIGFLPNMKQIFG